MGCECCRHVAEMEQLQVATACTQQFWRHKLATVTYCGVFWTFGLCIGFLGPTLLDLDCQVGEDRLGASTWLFFAQTALMLCGSLMVGFYLTVMTIEALLFQAVLIAMITLFIIPFCGNIYSLAIVLAVMGFQIGLIDAGGNIAMIQLHHNNVQPFLQAMHFFYGLGAFVSPMVSAPFLSEGECKLPPKNVPLNISFVRIPFYNDTNQWSEAKQLHWAFWIMGFSQVPILFLLAYLMITMKKMPQKSTDDYEELSDIEQNRAKDHEKTVHDRAFSHEPPYKCFSQYGRSESLFLLLTGFMLFMADGIQGGFADYVFSYGKRTIAHLSSGDAAHLNATFWGLFTLGRLIAVFLAIWLTAWKIFMMNIIGCGFSLVFLLVFAGNRTVLFLSAGAVGIFLASMAPAGISLAESTVGVTPSATTILVIMAALGEIVFPLVTGNLLDRNPLFFPYTLTVAVFAILIAYMACAMVSQRLQQKPKQ